MKQRVTRELFAYWNALRGARPAPDRSDLDPRAIRTCLAGTFVLTFDPGHGHPFRIAGTAVCHMFGRELTHAPFVPLWSAGDQEAIADLVRTLVDDARALVAGVAARNADGEVTELEMILLPLNGTRGAGRILGALTTVTLPYWLGVRPLQALRLGEVSHIGAGGVAMSAGGEYFPRRKAKTCNPGPWIGRARSDLAEQSAISRIYQG